MHRRRQDSLESGVLDGREIRLHVVPDCRDDGAIGLFIRASLLSLL